MSMDTRLLGPLGESLAAQWYRDAGYDLLAANFKTRQGEVDLIVQNEAIIAFVEVKTRGPHAIAEPCEWVDNRKQIRILRAAKAYLARCPEADTCRLRFDVAEVRVDAAGDATVTILEDAFVPAEE